MDFFLNKKNILDVNLLCSVFVHAEISIEKQNCVFSIQCLPIIPNFINDINRMCLINFPLRYIGKLMVKQH